MFKQYYHMSYNPFSKQVKDKDIYQTEDLKQVHGRLDHLKNTGGIGLITAEPGVGKTFALRTWRNKQNQNSTKFVYICMSSVTNREFYIELCNGLGVIPRWKKSDLFQDIQNCIKVLADERRMKVVICIDEAQYLPSSILKDLQMITNFDMDSRDLVSIILAGHSILNKQISRQPFESLQQRLIVNYQLEGLTEEQTNDYVQTQLSRVGADPNLFSEAAIISAASFAGRSIRKLNSIITNAFTIAAQKQVNSITPEIVQNATDELLLCN